MMTEESRIQVEGTYLEEKIPHLSFEGISSLDFSKNQIIWSPNGTGKTSIVKALKKKESLPFSYADLEESREDFKKNNDKLIIGLGIRQIERLRQENEGIINGLKIKSRLKDVGVSTLTDATHLFPKYPRCTVEQEACLLDYRKSAALKLANRLAKADLGFYVTHREQLNSLVDLGKDIEALKSLFVDRSLRGLRNAIDENEHTCPVCGYSSDRTILEIIEEKIEQFEGNKESLATNYAERNPLLTASEVEEKLQYLGEVRADDQELLSLCIGKGDKKECESVSKQRTTFKNNKKKIDELVSKNEQFFKNLKERRDELSNLFCTRYSVDDKDIVFDDDKKELVITLPRKVDTYSTGEVNLMITLVKVSEFLASNNEAMIFDDPLSSLDLANQYLVMFAFVKLADLNPGSTKRVTILTHNMNCISIAHSQHPGTFDYYCMERVGEALTLNPLSSSFFEKVREAFENLQDIRGYQSVKPGSLCAESIMLYRKQVPSPDTRELLPYLDVVLDREIENDPALHSVVHYRGSFTHPTLSLRNDFLVEAVEDFDESFFSRSSFEDRSIQKIFMLVALRVWVEKNIYDVYPDVFSQVKVEGGIGGVIEAVFAKGKWRGDGDITRQYLNSKKTMLNQSVHAKAQPAPFEFSINLSINNICSEINEMRERFRGSRS